jgi:phosphohistidine phosphatase SixA
LSEVAIYLIRHGSAGKRTGSSGDFMRPLDARGHEQAGVIAERLGDAGIAQVLSSPALRCQQTVGALAAKCKLEVDVADWLAEGNSEHAVLKKIAKLNDTNVVMCSHGDVIPEVVRALEARGMKVDGKRGWKKGAIWAIHMKDGTATQAEYFVSS